MTSKIQSRLVALQLVKKQRILAAIRQLQLIAMIVVTTTILLAYSSSEVSTSVYISLLPFFLIQIFSTRKYCSLAKTTRQLNLLAGGLVYPASPPAVSWTLPAGVAVRDSYFYLLIVFDASWLFRAYLYPKPAATFGEFLSHLAIGPISGTAFVVFTLLLWIFYAYLFVVGSLYRNELHSLENPLLQARFAKGKAFFNDAWIRVSPSAGTELYLKASHLSNPNYQPLILFPGFSQNGYVYHLAEDISLACYLWEQHYDVWIVHPRGTAQSEGRRKHTSLDDYACSDIPAIINHVVAETGKKPLFVGHSQGGITAIMSLLGAVRDARGGMQVDRTVGQQRQEALCGLVTLGSFPDFTFSGSSGLKRFVKEGLWLRLGKTRIPLLSPKTLLRIAERFVFLGTPPSHAMRQALARNRNMRIMLFPLTWILDFLATRKFWGFLYHLPNVARPQRKQLFYKTMDGTFGKILRQFYTAVEKDGMRSIDGNVKYAEHYHHITLPVSVVAMELDTLADPQMTKTAMFDAFSSRHKSYTLWKGMGHEDHFTDRRYFPLVLDAIQKCF